MIPLVLALLGCRTVLEPRVPAPEQEPAPAWERLLAEVVDEDGLVDYARLRERRDPLDRYVAWIGRPRPTNGRNLRHPFWLNAYNALVLYGILEAGVEDSVDEVAGGLPLVGGGFFHGLAFRVDGQPTSLAEIEHEHLRFKVLDFRDHAALVRGTASSPPLRPELYRARGLKVQLDDQMMRWVMDDARGVRIEGDEAVFSPLFERAAWDFSFQTVGDDLCRTAARFAVGEKKAALRELSSRGCPHRFAPHDPALNDAARGLPAGPRPTWPADEAPEGLGEEEETDP